MQQLQIIITIQIYILYINISFNDIILNKNKTAQIAAKKIVKKNKNLARRKP